MQHSGKHSLAATSNTAATKKQKTTAQAVAPDLSSNDQNLVIAACTSSTITDNARQSVESLAVAYDQRGEDLAKLQEESIAMTRIQAESERKIEVQQTELEKLAKIKQLLIKKAERYEAFFARSDEKLSTVLSSRDQLEQECKVLKERNVNLQYKNSSLEEKLKELQDQDRYLKVRIQDQNILSMQRSDQLVKKSAKVVALEKELAMVSELAAERNASVEKERVALRRGQKELEAERRKHTEVVAQHASEVRELREWKEAIILAMPASIKK